MTIRKNDIQKSATDEVEERIAELIQSNPITMTRAIAQQEVFVADPALYERRCAENTVGRDGQLLDRNPSLHNSGIGRTSKSVHTADEEVSIKARMLIAKLANEFTYEDTVNIVCCNQPEPYERWKNESYALRSLRRANKNGAVHPSVRHPLASFCAPGTGRSSRSSGPTYYLLSCAKYVGLRGARNTNHELQGPVKHRSQHDC